MASISFNDDRNVDRLDEALRWSGLANIVEDYTDLYYGSPSVIGGIPIDGSIYEDVHSAIRILVDASIALSGQCLSYVDVSREDDGL